MVKHTITFRDTLSAIHQQGKRKAFNIVHKKKDHDQLKIFTKSESTHEEIKAAGEQFMLKMYGASKYNSLNEYRYIAYK